MVNADNTITYTPDPGFTGIDVFSYLLDGVSSFVIITVSGKEAGGGGGGCFTFTVDD